MRRCRRRRHGRTRARALARRKCKSLRPARSRASARWRARGRGTLRRARRRWRNPNARGAQACSFERLEREAEVTLGRFARVQRELDVGGAPGVCGGCEPKWVKAPRISVHVAAEPNAVACHLERDGRRVAVAKEKIREATEAAQRRT